MLWGAMSCGVSRGVVELSLVVAVCWWLCAGVLARCGGVALSFGGGSCVVVRWRCHSVVVLCECGGMVSVGVGGSVVAVVDAVIVVVVW